MNTHPAFQRHLIAGLCAATVMAAPAWAASSQIRAQLDRPSLLFGESAQLAIIVKGSQPVEPNIPVVDGLEITAVGQQSSIQVINGAVSAEVRYIYQVTPNRSGRLHHSGDEASGVGSTQPIALRVEKSPAGQSARISRPGSSPLPAPSFAPAQEDAAPADAKGQPAFLRVVLPKKELTVGELVPVELKACFPAGMSASLNGLPMLAGGAFALNKLGENPEQTREVIDGRPYNVITWKSALSAVQAGDYPLNLELPVMVRVQEKVKRGGSNPFKDFFGDDSPFDDSSLDDFFGQVTEKPIVLHSDSTPVKVQPLPVQGRPADFSGAVGKFDLSAEASVAKAMTGDPITLKLKITGQGNFDRVTTTGLVSSAAWKGYKPNGQFEPADSDGFAGTKIFEQSIVPTQSGSSEIPAVSFSYFDPDSRSYVTKTAGPIPVEIALGSASPGTPAAPAPATVRAAGVLVPDRLEIGGASSLHPVVLAPWFLIANAVMAIATSIGLLARRWRQKRASDPQRQRSDATRAAVREAVSAMDDAIKNHNGVGFFQSARRVVTERLAERWSLPSSQVTPDEIRARLNNRGEKICALFRRSDEVAYSREKVTVSELTQWRADITQQLAHI